MGQTRRLPFQSTQYPYLGRVCPRSRSFSACIAAPKPPIFFFTPWLRRSATLTRVFSPVFFVLSVPAHLRLKASSKEHTQRSPRILACYLSKVPPRVQKLRPAPACCFPILINLLILFLGVLIVVPEFVSATDVRSADGVTSTLGGAQTVLEVPCLLPARTRCWVLIALAPRQRLHMLVMHHNSEPCTSNTWTTSSLRGGPTEGATTGVDRLAARTGNVCGADVTWRRKSHSTLHEQTASEIWTRTSTSDPLLLACR